MNKAGIRQQLIATLGRNDITNSLADSFIEQSVSRIQRTLRVPAMEKIVQTSFVGSQDAFLIPSDFLSMRYLYCGETLLELADIGRFLKLGKCQGSPKYYTRLGGEFKLFPQPTSGVDINLVYYGEIPDLAQDSDTNFLTAIAPDLLIYGALCFAADYFLDDRKMVFEEAFTRIYNEVQEQALLVEMEQSAMAIAPAYGSDY